MMSLEISPKLIPLLHEESLHWEQHEDPSLDGLQTCNHPEVLLTAPEMYAAFLPLSPGPEAISSTVWATSYEVGRRPAEEEPLLNEKHTSLIYRVNSGARKAICSSNGFEAI